MKIMVTGGAGFIGSNVVDGYIKEGHEVVVVDNLYSGKRENLNPDAVFYQTDVRSEDMSDIFEKERPDILNHHAAQMSVPASVEDPVFDADVNIKGFLNLLENAVKYKVRKCIFISSGGAIYGEACEYPTSEKYIPVPLSPYAISKFVSEHYLNFYKHQHNLEYTTLRYANVFGPRQIPHGEAGVVAIFMANILDSIPSQLFHFPEDESGMIRDYCYVGDIVRANIEALTKGSCDYFNIGTGRETKTRELYEIIYDAVKEMKPDISPELRELNKNLARPGDLTRSCLVTEKAGNILGWSPGTSIEEGIRLTLEWARNRQS